MRELGRKNERENEREIGRKSLRITERGTENKSWWKRDREIDWERGRIEKNMKRGDKREREKVWEWGLGRERERER